MYDHELKSIYYIFLFLFSSKFIDDVSLFFLDRGIYSFHRQHCSPRWFKERRRESISLLALDNGNKISIMLKNDFENYYDPINILSISSNIITFALAGNIRTLENHCMGLCRNR